MNPIKLFEYGAALAGSLFLILTVVFLFACVWFYLIGSAKGRE